VRTNVLPEDFVNELKDLIDEMPNLLSKIILKVAAKQAGPTIMQMLITDAADAIVSSNSDFVAYTGKKVLCIKELKY